MDLHNKGQKINEVPVQIGNFMLYTVCINFYVCKLTSLTLSSLS